LVGNRPHWWGRLRVFGSARIAVGLAHNAEPYASPLRAVMVAILVGQ